jgi:hypothetical protein
MQVFYEWTESNAIMILNDPTIPTRGNSCLDYVLLIPGSYIPPSLIKDIPYETTEKLTKLWNDSNSMENASNNKDIQLPLPSNTHMPAKTIKVDTKISDHIPLLLKIDIPSTKFVRSKTLNINKISKKRWAELDKEAKDLIEQIKFPDFNNPMDHENGKININKAFKDLSETINKVIKYNARGRIVINPPEPKNAKKSLFDGVNLNGTAMSREAAKKVPNESTWQRSGRK